MRSKLILALLTFLVATFSFNQTFALENSNNEERIKHYASNQPNSTNEALNLLEVKIFDIDKIIKKPKLNNIDLESIHETSYFLEAAIDYLRGLKGYRKQKALDQLDEAIQILHYASENHKENEVRNSFMNVKPAFRKVRRIFK